MKTRHKKYFTFGLALLILAALHMTTGCASFPGHQLPQVTPSQYARIESRPSVFLDVNFYVYAKGMHSQPVEDYEGRQSLLSVVNKVTTESQLFYNFTTDSSRAIEMDYTIRLNLTNYGSGTGATIAGLISGFTLFIIPTWAKDRYRLETVIYDNQGNELQQYKYEDHMTTWVHFIFIPMIGSVKKTPIKVITNMMRNFYYDLAQAPFFERPQQWQRFPEKEEEPPPFKEQRRPKKEIKEVRVKILNAVVRLRPNTESLVILNVPSGAILSVKEKKGEWYYVELPPDKNGYVVTGYIHQDSVEEIK